MAVNALDVLHLLSIGSSCTNKKTLNTINDFLNIGGEEYLKPKKGITLIEWADIIEEIFDDSTIRINFSRIEDNQNSRKISIEGIDIAV